MERLDILITSLNELRNNRTFRLDSTFYDKTAVSYELKIKEMKHIFIPENQVVSGPFGSSLTSDAYLDAGVPFIRIEDIKGGFTINTDQMIYISEADDARLKSSQLNVNDIILSKVGNSIGFYARVDEEIGHCNISENNIGIKLLDFSDEKKHFILTYLNSKYGKVLTNRRRSGNAQPKLNVFDIAEIPIPEMSHAFEVEISKLILKSFEWQKNAKQKYEEASRTLLQELGMENWQPNNNPCTVKSFKDISGAGRIDAEYYQRKYDDLLNKLEKYDCCPLNKIVAIKKSIEPGSKAYQETGIPFYRVSNLTEEGLSDTDIYLDEDKYYTDELALKKNTILFSKDGSIGIAYKVREDIKAITSGALLHFTIIAEDVLPDYLVVVLNSKIVKMQSERDAGGSVIQHWKPDEIEKVVIPVIGKPEQEKISALVQDSFKLRDESKQLIETAKKAVEIAIEQGETKALKLFAD